MGNGTAHRPISSIVKQTKGEKRQEEDHKAKKKKKKAAESSAGEGGGAENEEEWRDKEAEQCNGEGVREEMRCRSEGGEREAGVHTAGEAHRREQKEEGRVPKGGTGRKSSKNGGRSAHLVRMSKEQRGHGEKTYAGTQMK